MRQIKLTQHQVAIVDDDDFDNLNHHEWHAHYDKRIKLFYARRSYVNSNGKQVWVSMHRAILGVTDPAIVVDHINHEPLDNFKANLRLANNCQNQGNQRKSKHNTSGHRGVSWSKVRQKWMAQIKIHGVLKRLGAFTDIQDAVSAYKVEAVAHFGEFANFD